MSVQEKRIKEDIALYEVMRHPAWCLEFVQNSEVGLREKFELHDYQNNFLCDFSPEVSFASSRSVGKTLGIIGLFTWALVNNPYNPTDYFIYFVPNQTHLKPVWTVLTELFRNNPVLKSFTKSINSSDFFIKMYDGAYLDCRIAGSLGTGQNIKGVHSPLEVVDEAQDVPWGDWTEMNPTINRETPGHRRVVSGVSIGVREKNVLFHADMENDGYTKHRITSYRSPRFTKKDLEDALITYGGEDSADFLRNILGRHSSPAFVVFSRVNFKMVGIPVWKSTIRSQSIPKGSTYSEKLAYFSDVLELLPPVKEGVEYYFGVDAGFSPDPSAIYIGYFDKDEKFTFQCKIALYKLEYSTLQAPIIDMLDSKYKPKRIGIDAVGAGVALPQELQTSPKYAHKNYEKRVFPVMFQASMIVGYDADNKEIKRRVRPFLIELLQVWSNEHRIQYSSTDMDIVSELERMDYSRSNTGEKKYNTRTERGGQRGKDHFTSALLCIVAAKYSDEEVYTKRNKQKRPSMPAMMVRIK